MVRPNYMHQTGFFDPGRFALPVHVIGVGGIGSPLVYALMKLGVRLVHVWDPDVVEEHNVPAQFYRISDVGRLKVEAIAEIMALFDPGCTVECHAEEVTNTTRLEGVVFSAVDSMKSRAEIWQAVMFNGLVPRLIDSRMGGLEIASYSVDPSHPDHVNWYGEWLYPDEEAAPLPCAERTVIDPPMVLVGRMVRQFCQYVQDPGAPAQRNSEHLDGPQLQVDKITTQQEVK